MAPIHALHSDVQANPASIAPPDSPSRPAPNVPPSVAGPHAEVQAAPQEHAGSGSVVPPPTASATPPPTTHDSGTVPASSPASSTLGLFGVGTHVDAGS